MKLCTCKIRGKGAILVTIKLQQVQRGDGSMKTFKPVMFRPCYFGSRVEFDPPVSETTYYFSWH